MKTFFKVFMALVTFFGTVIAALAVFDKFTNKNRIEGDYLECDIANEDEPEEE